MLGKPLALTTDHGDTTTIPTCLSFSILPCWVYFPPGWVHTSFGPASCPAASHIPLSLPHPVMPCFTHLFQRSSFQECPVDMMHGLPAGATLGHSGGSHHLQSQIKPSRLRDHENGSHFLNGARQSWPILFGRDKWSEERRPKGVGPNPVGSCARDASG